MTKMCARAPTKIYGVHRNTYVEVTGPATRNTQQEELLELLYDATSRNKITSTYNGQTHGRWSRTLPLILKENIFGGG